MALIAASNADIATMRTTNYVEEAIGAARAAKKYGMPIAISFTCETDGKLPTGMSLKDAIEAVDKDTDNYPAYFMINCAHPTHFDFALKAGVDEPWTKRLTALNCNASMLSHAELEKATKLDDGNPELFGQ